LPFQSLQFFTLIFKPFLFGCSASFIYVLFQCFVLKRVSAFNYLFFLPSCSVFHLSSMASSSFVLWEAALFPMQFVCTSLTYPILPLQYLYSGDHAVPFLLLTNFQKFSWLPDCTYFVFLFPQQPCLKLLFSFKQHSILVLFLFLPQQYYGPSLYLPRGIF